VARGFACITVLDVCRAALDRARARLSPNDRGPRWLEADVTSDWQVEPVDIWHDRAAFHFLTNPADRAAYVEHVAGTVKPGGHVIIATFAADGPERCSGLPVVRYSPEALAHEFRDVATPISSTAERHVTPTGGVQSFSYSLLKVR
jgi:SAM-dependent methyltransferase